MLKGGEDEKSIVAAYQTLTHPDKMGERSVNELGREWGRLSNVDVPIQRLLRKGLEIGGTNYHS